MLKKRLFLASSAELEADRKEFEIFIGRKNKDWFDRGVFLELIVWEDFLDAVSKTRLQDEYNKAIRECDVFVMLFFTKVGPYTEEEFETAFGQFKATNKPFIFTYFKHAEISTGSANTSDLMSLRAFQDKLKALGHYQTVYETVDGLKLHFGQQLDKLAANRFIELKPEKGEAAAPGGYSYQATLTGGGAIAQGPQSTAVGAGAVYVGGKNTGSINTGTKVDTGGGAYVGGAVNTGGGDFVGRDHIVHGDRITTGEISGTGIAIGRGAQANATQGVSLRDLEPLFAALSAAVVRAAPADKQTAARQQVEALKEEIANNERADDGQIAKIVHGLVEMVPGAIGAVVNLFATPILGGIAGPVTKLVLDKLKAS